MPARYEIGDRFVRIHLDGSVGDADPLAMARRLLTDPALRPGLAFLCDHTALEDAASPELVEASLPLFEVLGERLGPTRVAIAVSSDVSFGMARMTQARTDDTQVEIRVFRDVDDAERWLTRPPEPVSSRYESVR